MVFVDIGANVGIHTLHAARLVGATGVVHAFEPDPKTFEILTQNVQANGLQASIQLHQQALLDRNGELPLYRAAGMSTWNSVFAGNDGRPSVIVPCVTLDEALAGTSRIDVIKLDAEGAEPAILRGMNRILERNPDILILMEYAPPHLQRSGISPSGFLDQLTADGFQIAAVDDATGELSEVDRERLPSAFSVNLSLRKSVAPLIPPEDGKVPDILV
jgi:FkbM family methyltransferase